MKLTELNDERPKYLEIATTRIKGKRWTVFVCAEPDGQDCDSGTHPNILSHKCEAIRKFHDSEGHHPGPQLVEVSVVPITFSDSKVVELTDKELSATIEAFSVVDNEMDGRPPLKNRSPISQFTTGKKFRHVDGSGSSAWRKFIDAEAGR